MGKLREQDKLNNSDDLNDLNNVNKHKKINAKFCCYTASIFGIIYGTACLTGFSIAGFGLIKKFKHGAFAVIARLCKQEGCDGAIYSAGHGD